MFLDPIPPDPEGDDEDGAPHFQDPVYAYDEISGDDDQPDD